MADSTFKDWSAETVSIWLNARIASAKSDQVMAERGGRGRQDDCDKASAEEMVCSLVRRGPAIETQQAFSDTLQRLLGQDDYLWPGIYDDTRFARRVRTFIKKLVRMTKQNEGFANISHYQ